jgi:hypothetical protein
MHSLYMARFLILKLGTSNYIELKTDVTKENSCYVLDFVGRAVEMYNYIHGMQKVRVVS